MDIGGVNATSIATSVWLSATRTLTSGGGITFGQKIQSPVTVSAISLTTAATTTVLNYSATGGVILIFGVSISTGITGGNVTDFIDITTDGNLFSIPLHTAGQQWDSGMKAIAHDLTGTGGGVGDAMNIPIYFGFNTSIVVALRVSVTTATTGAANVTAFYSHP